MKSKDTGGPSFLDKVIDTQLDYAGHPEKYPFYVLGFTRYPSEMPHKFGITDIPEMFSSSVDEREHKAFLIVQEGSDFKETLAVAKELAGLMNKANGKNLLPQ